MESKVVRRISDVLKEIRGKANPDLDWVEAQ